MGNGGKRCLACGCMAKYTHSFSANSKKNQKALRFLKKKDVRACKPRCDKDQSVNCKEIVVNVMARLDAAVTDEEGFRVAAACLEEIEETKELRRKAEAERAQQEAREARTAEAQQAAEAGPVEAAEPAEAVAGPVEEAGASAIEQRDLDAAMLLLNLGNRQIARSAVECTDVGVSAAAVPGELLAKYQLLQEELATVKRQLMDVEVQGGEEVQALKKQMIDLQSKIQVTVSIALPPGQC